MATTYTGMTLAQIEAAKSQIYAHGAKHSVATTSTPYGYRGSVARPPYTYEEPRAHGAVCYRQRCLCGAAREINSNGRYEETSPWGLPRELIAAEEEAKAAISAETERKRRAVRVLRTGQLELPGEAPVPVEIRRIPDSSSRIALYLDGTRRDYHPDQMAPEGLSQAAYTEGWRVLQLAARMVLSGQVSQVWPVGLIQDDGTTTELRIWDAADLRSHLGPTGPSRGIRVRMSREACLALHGYDSRDGGMRLPIFGYLEPATVEVSP